MICTYCNKRPLCLWRGKPGKTCGHSDCKKAWRQSPEGKAKRKAWRQSPEGKAKKKAYEQSPEGKAKRKAYEQSPKRKAKMKAWRQSPERKAYMKDRYKKIGRGYRKKAIWDILHHRQGGACNICNFKIPEWENRTKDFHIDHIFPAALMTPKRRNKDINNLQILCRSCNLSKRDNPFFFTKTSEQGKLAI